MAPCAVPMGVKDTLDEVPNKTKLNSTSKTTYLLDRDIHRPPPAVAFSIGNYITLQNGQRIYDASCGVAVSCLGHGNKEVLQAMMDQMNANCYTASLFFGTPVADKLARQLIDDTKNRMSRAFIVSSGKSSYRYLIASRTYADYRTLGSEAIEAAMKLARQYFLELSVPQEKRVNFIAREHSYHGATIGA